MSRVQPQVPAPIDPEEPSAPASHTQGPWQSRRTKSGYALKISGFGWTDFCRVFVKIEEDESDHPEGLANAALILAAPDLLEALKELTLSCDGHGEAFREAYETALAVIAKAEGR